MNVQPISREVSRRRFWPLLLAVIIMGLVAGLAWGARINQPTAFNGMVLPGHLVSVSLTNGQVYYGSVLRSAPEFIQLTNVHYVQANRLVRRDQNDWHGPEWMVVPIDRIQMIEQIGEQSRLAKMIGQASRAN